MKDLEKIKSEDLAAQVQDANPANFAIEQEVAQLVGATVPQPTDPSADDARELGAQLLVFLRRALLPIQTALRTAVAAIYAHLDSRCTAYTPAAYDPFRLPAGPYDPMRPFVPRTLPNLLTALTAFSARKISGVPEAPDGISVLNLLSNGSNIKVYDDSDQAYPLKDGVVNTLLSLLPIETLTLGMRTASGNHCVIGNGSTANTTLKGTVNFANMEEYGRPNEDGQNGLIKNCPNVDTVLAEKLHSIKHYARNEGEWRWAVIGGMAGLKCIKFGDFDEYSGTWTGGGNFIINCPKLLDLRFKSLSCSLNLKYWIPDETVLDGGDNQALFLQNFKEHIALRLTANGSGKTLTLSQAVRDAIHAAEATYGIEAIIVTQKGWTLSPAPGASSQ